MEKLRIMIGSELGKVFLGRNYQEMQLAWHKDRAYVSSIV
jgi:hypothetical protein